MNVSAEVNRRALWDGNEEVPPTKDAKGGEGRLWGCLLNPALGLLFLLLWVFVTTAVSDALDFPTGPGDERDSWDALLAVGLSNCVNGGVPSGSECVCPIYYTGADCSKRQCPNSVDGSGPYSILPPNSSTMFCDRCNTTDFTGLNCQQCRRDAACEVYAGVNSSCNSSVFIRGDNKHFQCTLNSPYFIRLLGDGRNITAEVMLNCSTADGSAFSAADDGRCHMTIYRIEPKKEYVDPFFRCTASSCSMRSANVSDADASDPDKGRSSAFFEGLRVVGQVTLLTLSGALALLGCCAHSLGYKRLRSLTLGLGGALCSAAVLFIVLMMVSMQPRAWKAMAVYECRSTSCACAEDAPERYQPICSQSDVLAGQILPSIKNSIRFVCSVASGACQLTLTDLALVFDLDCDARECVDESRFPSAPPSTDNDHGATLQQRLLWVLFVCVQASLIGVLVHWLCLRKRSAQRAKDFWLIFGSMHVVAADNNISHHVERGGEDASDCSINTSSEHAPFLADTEGRQESAVQLTALATPERAQRYCLHKIRALTRSPLKLTVDHLHYSLPEPCFAERGERSGNRTILQQIHFTVRSGDVLAIMGCSGAGKTTLLDLLAARAKSGIVRGSVLLNGSPVHTTGKRAARYRTIVGYVSQEDTLLPALTVRQTIEYAARLKLPKAFSAQTLDKIVTRMIEVLKLRQCEHTMVGDGSAVRGISGGERRRVSIAVELLANPRILLLDEPTSGLDTISASRVIEAIVGLAKDFPMRHYAPYYFSFRPIVIFSIHQPSQEIFAMFDSILLLSRGMSVYCGPAHTATAVMETRVRDAFGGTRVVLHRESYHNCAEYLMKLEETFDDSVRQELQEQDIRTHMQQRQPPMIDTEDVKDIMDGEQILYVAESFKVYYANVYEQFSLLTSRALTCLIGSFHLIACHAAVVTCLASLMCLLYHGQALDLPGSLNRAGCVSYLLLVTSLVSLSCLEQLVLERKLFIVERENGFYTTLPYLMSKLVVDVVPLRVIPAVVLASVIYFPMGFRTDAGEHFFWFFLIIALFSVCMTLLIMSIGIMTGSFGTAALLSSVFVLWCFVFGGSMVQAETIPFFLKPFKSVSPFFLAFESLMVNELDGQACVFSPTDETGKPSPDSIPIMCRQYLANVGLKPERFKYDVMQLGVYAFSLVFFAWLLLGTFTRLVR